jgi:hypothetical protein
VEGEKRDHDVWLRLSNVEAIALYEVLGYSEWAGTREGLELRDDAEYVVLDRLLVALQPLISELGTDDYARAVADAWASLRGQRRE